MAISAPLPSTALSAHPLRISLSLSSLPAPPPPSSATNDPFDAFDDAADTWDVDQSYAQPADETAQPEQPAEGPLPSSSSSAQSSLSSALADSTRLLFPHTSLRDEAQLAAAESGAAEGSEGELPGMPNSDASTPRLHSRTSSTSVSTVSSSTTTAPPRRPSSSADNASSSGRPYDVLRSVSRPRKASATVSVSTSSAVPSSAHGHAHDLPDLPDVPMSPPPTSPRTSSSPTSPTIPHFTFTGPSPTPSQNPLGSIKEARAPSSSAASSVGADGTASPQKRKHSRAKESIASGIGLWEMGDGGAASSRSSLASPTEETSEEQLAGWGILPEDVEQAEEKEGEVEEELDRLVPVLKIRTAGWGEVVALEVREDLRCADETEGAALLVLRQSGHLSIVSLVDGRSFGSCDAGSTITSSSSASAAAFAGLQIAVLNEITFAFCMGSPACGIISPIELDSLVPQEALVGDFGGAIPVVFSQHGFSYLLHLSSPPPSSESPDPPNILFSRLSGFEAAGIKPSSVCCHLGAPQPAGVLGGLSGGTVQGLRRCGEEVLAWGEKGMVLFTIRDQHIVPLAQLDSPAAIKDVYVSPSGETVVLRAKEKLQTHEVERREGEFSFTLFSHTVVSDVEHITALPLEKPSILISRQQANESRSLELVDFSSPTPSVTPTSALYRSLSPEQEHRVTTVKLLPSNRVLLGYSSGGISILDLADLASAAEPPLARAALVGAITLLETVELGGRQVVIAGSASGMAGAWNLSDWDLMGTWTLFASPVKSFAFIDPSPTPSSKLGNSLAFISANSPVALVSLHPPDLLFVLPGTKSAVELIATTRSEIMVLYEQGLARTCDIGSRELRRSMDRRTAERALADGEWQVWFRLGDSRKADFPALPPTDPYLHLDLRTLLDDAARLLPWTDGRSAKKRDQGGAETPDGSPNLSKNGAVTPPREEVDPRATARGLIAALAIFGLDAGLDEMLEQLAVLPPAVPLASAIQSSDALALPATESLGAPWTVSPVATAQRLLRLVCLLRVFLNYPGSERTASQAIVYYASCLADSVGPAFAEPSLDVFAHFWLDKSSEVQQAARSLFGTYLASLPDDSILAFVEWWQEKLPARQHGTGVLHHQADHAVLVIGLVATDRYKLLSSSVLKDVSLSISAYLEDHEHPSHQAAATELCSRGFGIWQNYVDAMSLVRQLFAIAIGRNPATPNDLRLLARNATLHVAGVNTPLFMSTLVHDILNSPTATTRNATLKLLGFMIRKKPLVLYTSLPRVAEAVVKSLDPTVTSLRETVHQAATVILNELVRTFPSIDFHGKSQRLAVGTAEGAAIVFDLRTATRLYVLEGHKHAVTALSFSPDGHRLVTVSLEESRVAAWKVGTGLFSMFTAGAPPRQGTGGAATPFKTYDFHVGEEGLMTTAATLEWVVFDWPAERTVRLRLRETALNFGV
ncbi:hypothetical protein JCM8097_008980 [Rhodosporidiobolus ruineniae]